MAIFSSILLEKVRGSVGNITTSRLKGQQIAKAKITSTTVVNSVAQVESKHKMTNSVLLWQTIGMFLENWVGQAKQVESVYNAFVRGIKSYILDIVPSTITEIWGSLTGFSMGKAYGVIPTDFTLTGITGLVSWSNLLLEFPSDFTMRVIGVDSVTNLPFRVDYGLNNADYIAGEKAITVPSATSTSLCVYFFSLIDKKSSVIYFK